MSSTPIEIAARMATIHQWMDAHAFAAIEAAVIAKLARREEWA